MGNKTGKFNVPTTEKVKDEQVISDIEVKADVEEHVEANGDHPKQESNGVDKSETAPEAKKKNIVSWFKKVSLRKEKKPKAPKENGVKEEVVEAPKENGIKEENVETVKESSNGDIHTDNVESKEEATPDVHVEEKETLAEVSIDNKDESPMSNGHENITENSETPVEAEQ